MSYAPYPYEPQFNTVNNIKIYNADLQNKSQVRGLIETIRKDLRVKNQAIEAAKVQMKQFISSSDCQGVSSQSNQVDIFAFQH